MKLVSEIVTEWLEKKKDEVRMSYESKGLKASGRFGQSLAVDVVQNENKITARLTGNSYGYYMENGRGKTKGGGDGSLRSIIRQWIDDKGIVPHDKITKDSLSYLITRKIHEQGIKVPNAYNQGGVFSDVFTPKSIKDLADQIGADYLKTVSSDIIKTFS